LDNGTEQGYKTSEAARSLGIGDNLIRRWKQEFEEEASGAQLGADEREELKQLRKEIGNLTNTFESGMWTGEGLSK